MPIMIKTSEGLEEERKMSTNNVVKAQITSQNVFADAFDLIDEDLNTTLQGDESSEGEIDETEVMTASGTIFKESFDVPKVLWDLEPVKDWDYRTQNYTEEQKQIYKEMVPKVMEMKGMAKSH